MTTSELSGPTANEKPGDGLPRTGAILATALAAMAGLPLGVALARWGAAEGVAVAFTREVLAASLLGWGFLAVSCTVAILMALLRPERLVERAGSEAMAALRRRPWLLHVAIWTPLIGLAAFGGSIGFWRVALVLVIALATALHAMALRNLATGFGIAGAVAAFAYGAGLGWVMG